jgi:hypothetical protein
MVLVLLFVVGAPVSAATRPIAFVPTGTGVFVAAAGVEDATAQIVAPGIGGTGQDFSTCTGTVSFTGGVASCAPPSGGGGWTTAEDCNLATEASQTFTTDGLYTFCGGLSWKKENSAQETTHGALVNGTGLVFTNYQFSCYGSAANLGGCGDSERSSPLLWLSLGQLGITNLDWSTSLRIWVDVPTQTTDASGITALVFGVDNDPGSGTGALSTWYSIFGARTCSNTNAPATLSWFYTASPTSTLTSTNLQGGLTSWTTANQTSVLWIPALASDSFRTTLAYGTAYSGGWTGALIPWGARFDTATAGRGSVGFANSITSPTTIGSDLGIVLAFTGSHFVATPTIAIARIRIDYHL